MLFARRTAFALILTGVAAGFAAAQGTPPATPAGEQIDNPEYASWSKLNKGASVTLKLSGGAGGQTNDVVMVNKLVEVTADKVVIETEATVTAGGKEFKQPPMKRDVPKSVALPPGVKKDDFGTPPGTTKTAEETLKVGGTEVKAKRYEYTTKTPTGDMSGKLWTSPDVPGLLVKVENEIAGATPFKQTIVATEFKK